MSSAICKTCGHTFDWHSQNVTQHSFNDGSIPGSVIFRKRQGEETPASDAAPEVVHARWPFDPVLRQALIDKGVVTPEDLQEAERKIRAVTAAWEQQE